MNTTYINDNIRERELIKCRKNPFYFIYNYVKIPEIGGYTKIYPHTLNPKMKRVVKLILRYHSVICMASRQLGKALSIDTPISLPNGEWKILNDIVVGDLILGADGKSTKVTNITNIMYNHNCYKIEFDYADPIIADEDHLWKINSGPVKIKNKIMTTKELIDLCNKKASKEGMPNIDISKPIKNTKKDFIIDPYILGMWLGDGSKNAARIAISCDDYDNISKNFIERNVKITQYKPKKGANSGYFGIYNFLPGLRQLNLFGNKHIPRIYFSGSIKQRLELLRGLMDSDGNCSQKGDCEFYQKDHNLIIQIRELLTSLGIKSRIRTKIIKSETYYIVKFCTRQFYVFNLKRKRELQKRCKNHIKNTKHYIKSITPIDSVPVRCLTVDNNDHMFLCGTSMIPTHNSTIAACMIAWALLFYQESYAIILNMKQTAALKNLAMVKFVIMNLPPWMINAPNTFKSKSDLKTKLELFNNSKAEAFYPATSHSSSTIARSLTSAILYVDEAAHIKDMKEIWGSAQPILSTARAQAASRGYPYFQFITSTPNGTLGDGEWFFDRWNNSVDSELLFDYDQKEDSEIWTPKYNIDDLVNDPSKNGFVKVRYHWREDPLKTEEWYLTQKRELSDDRKVNQELDLKFVGSNNCIFPDELLSKLNQQPIMDVKPFIHSAMLEIYSEEYPLNNKDYYIIGVDTAYSLEGAYNAIQVFQFSNFRQIAELQIKLSSYTQWGQIIHEVFQWLYKQVGDRIILSIENNTIGRAPIEHLLNHTDFPYHMFMFKQNSKDPYDDKFGITTTGTSKPVLLGTLLELVNDYPENICSSRLIGQFGSLHRTSGGTIKSSSYSDLAMASSFCAYARKYKALEILPKIHFTSRELESKKFDNFKQVINILNTKPKPITAGNIGLGDPYDDPNYFRENTGEDKVDSTNFFSFF